MDVTVAPKCRDCSVPAPAEIAPLRKAVRAIRNPSTLVSPKMIDIRLFEVCGEFVLASPQVPDWRCKGVTHTDVMANCAGSLRDHLKTAVTLTPHQVFLIAKTLEVRAVQASTARQTQV